MCCEIHECPLTALLQELREVLAEEEEDRAGSVAAVLPDRSFVLPLALTCSLFAVQVTNHSAAFGHVTTILPSDWQALCGVDMVCYYNGVIFKHVGVAPEHVAILYQV